MKEKKKREKSEVVRGRGRWVYRHIGVYDSKYYQLVLGMNALIH